MRIKDIIELPNVLNYTKDDSAIYFLIRWGSGIQLCILDALSFKIVSRFSIPVDLNPFTKPCVDESCIYVSNNNGEILALDKFSGEKLIGLDLGMMINVSDLCQDNENIYSLCGIPITDGVKINTHKFCICINNKITGKKIYQSQSLQGVICSIYLDNYIWGTVGKKLFKCDKQCEMKTNVNLNFTPNYKPIMTNEFIVCASITGSLEIFNKNLQSHAKLMVSENKFAPIQMNNNCLLWAVQDTLFVVNLQDKCINSIFKTTIPFKSNLAKTQSSYFVANESGRLLNINNDGKLDNSIDMKDTTLFDIIIIEDNLILVSQSHLYLVET